MYYFGSHNNVGQDPPQATMPSCAVVEPPENHLVACANNASVI